MSVVSWGGVGVVVVGGVGVVGGLFTLCSPYSVTLYFCNAHEAHSDKHKEVSNSPHTKARDTKHSDCQALLPGNFKWLKLNQAQF